MKSVVPIIGYQSLQPVLLEEAAFKILESGHGILLLGESNIRRLRDRNPLRIEIPFLLSIDSQQQKEQFVLLEQIAMRFVNNTRVIRLHDLFAVTELETCPELSRWPRDLSETCRKALNFIYESIGNSNLSSIEIANSVNVSESKLRKLFKKELGQSLWENVISQRMQCAQRLLRSTEIPMGDIALAVGYHDLSTFDHIFLSQFGVSPSEMAKKDKAKIG
jgi:AraC-like DNA-binding protein